MQKINTVKQLEQELIMKAEENEIVMVLIPYSVCEHIARNFVTQNIGENGILLNVKSIGQGNITPTDVIKTIVVTNEIE
jgi:hypothetical protein